MKQKSIAIESIRRWDRERREEALRREFNARIARSLQVSLGAT